MPEATNRFKRAILAKPIAACLRFCWRHKILTAALAIVIALSITPIIILTRTYGIVHTSRRPSLQPIHEPVLEVQTETFTCGVHTLSMIYKVYGLDPEAERIRWRLGADTKAAFYLSDSTGVLHPDLYMAAVQDYFEVRAVDLTGPGAWGEILAHLGDGHWAALLIARRENGHLHWVAAADPRGDAATIYDSLAPQRYLEHEDFLQDHIVTALLLRPTPDGTMAMSSVAAHRAGMSELTKATKRIKELERR